MYRFPQAVWSSSRALHGLGIGRRLVGMTVVGHHQQVISRPDYLGHGRRPCLYPLRQPTLLSALEY